MPMGKKSGAAFGIIRCEVTHISSLERAVIYDRGKLGGVMSFSNIYKYTNVGFFFSCSKILYFQIEIGNIEVLNIISLVSSIFNAYLEYFLLQN